MKMMHDWLQAAKIAINSEDIESATKCIDEALMLLDWHPPQVGDYECGERVHLDEMQVDELYYLVSGPDATLMRYFGSQIYKDDDGEDRIKFGFVTFPDNHQIRFDSQYHYELDSIIKGEYKFYRAALRKIPNVR